MISPWIGGVMLALVPVAHRAVLGRQLAVSGRLTALVDRATEPQSVAPEMSDEELAAAFAAATEAAFGAEAVHAEAVRADAIPPEPASCESASPTLAPTRSLSHVAFFVGLAIGGLAVAAASGNLVLSLALRGDAFARALGSGPGAWLVLGLAGVLVGFGTRMAGGCTSGHGLCGVGRREPGSLVATATFFGSGVAVATLLEVLT